MEYRTYIIGPDRERAKAYYAPSLDWAFRNARQLDFGLSFALNCYGSYEHRA